MKKLFILTAILLASLPIYAQKTTLADGIRKQDLPVIYLPDSLSVHFLSPEPIQYVDISSNSIVGDLPVKNMLRIKYRTDSARHLLPHDAVVTIVGEKFIAQYQVLFSPDSRGGAILTDIEINPKDMRPLDYPGVSLSQPELKNYALSLMAKKPEKHLAHSKAYGIKANLNHVYTLGDYIFLDIGFENGTNLGYAIDAIRFKIDDRKVIKATNVQSVEITPDFTLFNIPNFKRYYRNIFVFKKFTFPDNKVFHIELSEKQLSGRTIELEVPYKKILASDIIPVSEN
jgi:conjugative transposon TraN protein